MSPLPSTGGAGQVSSAGSGMMISNNYQRFRPPQSGIQRSQSQSFQTAKMLPDIKVATASAGYAFIPELRPDCGIEEVARIIGKPLTPWEGGLIQDLVPLQVAPPNTYSGIYGLGRFPFHTDLAHWHLPPRYLLLRCIVGYAAVPTLLLDGRTLLADLSPDLLTRALVKPRRPMSGAIRLFRICEATDNGYRLRWDEVFLKPASRIGAAAYQAIGTHVQDREATTAILARTGDTLLIDNWRMLHARSPIPSCCAGRRIQRVYLENLC